VASNNEAKIKFTAETSDFTQAISDANREMSSLKAEMKLADATFKNTGDSAEYQQQKLDLLQQALEANHEKQEALTGKLEAAKEIYGEDSKEVQTLEKQLTNAKTEEQNLLNQVNDTNGGLDQQKESAEDAGTAVDDMASILVNAEVAGKVKEIAEAALEMAQNFDEAKAAIVEGTGASGENLQGLQQAAQDAFGEIADADSDLSTVSGTLAELNTRFGLTGKDATDMTVKMSKFAKATGTDGTKAVDSMADIMHRWNLDLDDADGLLDDLTTANQSCQLSVDDLSKYLAGNSTQFQELGYSTDEALAMLISLSDGGADVGTVMSGLTKGVANLSDTTDDVPGTFRKAIDAIGKCDNVSEALQTQVGDTGKTVEQIFGKKAAQELATNIQNGSFAIEDWTAILGENDGALETTSEGVTTMKDAWTQATNNVSMALGATMAPAISNVVKKVSEVITKVAQVVQKSPVLQAVIIGVATALGVLGAALAISSVITAVTKAFSLLNTTLLTNPIFLVVTAIAALAAGLVYAYKHSEKFRNIVNKAFNAVKKVVLPVLEAIRDFAVKAFQAIKDKVSKVMPQIKDVISKVWNTIKTVVSTVANAIKTVVSTVFNAVKSFVQKNQNTIKTIISTVWNAIKNVVTTYINAVKTVITTVWNTIKKTVTTVVTSIKTVISSIFGAIKALLKGDMAAVKQNLTNAWNAIKTAISAVVSGIKTIISTYFNAMKAVISSIMSGIRSVISAVWNAIKGNVSAVLSGIKSVVTTAWNGIKTAISTAMSSIKTAISTAWSTIKTTISTALSGIKTAVSTAWSTIKTSISTALSNIKSTVSTGFSNVKTTISTAWSNVKTNTSTAWSNIKTSVSTGISGAKTAISTAVSGIKTTMSGAWSSIKSTASSAWSGIKSAMTSPITTAKSTISGILSKIKGLFPLSIGKVFSGIKLPHFSVSGGSPPFGILGKGSLPSWSVSWYAKGAVFKKPTIFGTNMGWAGVGEAGKEAVAPIDTLKQYVEEAVEAGSTTIDYDHLADKVAAACARMNISINLDNRTLGRVVREMV